MVGGLSISWLPGLIHLPAGRSHFPPGVSPPLQAAFRRAPFSVRRSSGPLFSLWIVLSSPPSLTSLLLAPRTTLLALHSQPKHFPYTNTLLRSCLTNSLGCPKAILDQKSQKNLSIFHLAILLPQGNELRVCCLLK